MLKLGTVAIDGSKLHAHASRHSALSYGHAKKVEQQPKKELQQLLRLAEHADAADIPDGMSIPEELERRELRLAAIAEARARIEPLIAMGREQHHAGWKQRFVAALKAPPQSATLLQKMAYRLKTPPGRKLYALRKQTPEPVFGIINPSWAIAKRCCEA